MKTRSALVVAGCLLACSGAAWAVVTEPATAASAVVVDDGARKGDGSAGATAGGGSAAEQRQGAKDAPRDGRVWFGDISISRPRFGEASVKRAGGGSAIAVPSNTLGSGESLQQRATRETAERRSAEADARERDAAAEIARTEATLAEDRIRDGVAYIGRSAGVPVYGRVYFGGGRGHRVGPWIGGRRWSGLGERDGGTGGRPTVTVERFVGDSAIHSFAGAATPPISAIQRGLDRDQRAFGANARPPVARIQEEVDRAVIGDRLRRTTVRETDGDGAAAQKR